jgi:PAS domain S-box-containing protein
MDVTNELAKQLLDAAPDPTVIVDQDGTVVFANARVAEVLGYTNEELIGEPVEILLPERARVPILMRDQWVMRSNFTRCVKTVLRYRLKLASARS